MVVMPPLPLQRVLGWHAPVPLRHGRHAHLDAAEVDRFLDHVEQQIAQAIKS
jgi:hypothetical protein